MPSKNTRRVSEIAVRKDPLTEDEWFEAVENARALVVRMIKSMQLQALGDVEVVRRGASIPSQCGIALRQYLRQAGFDDREAFAMRGLFKVAYFPHKSSESRFVVQSVWGLRRDGRWFVFSTGDTAQASAKHLRGVGYEVCDLPRLCAMAGVKPEEVHSFLHMRVSSFVRYRENLLDEARRLREAMDFDADLLRAIPVATATAGHESDA